MIKLRPGQQEVLKYRSGWMGVSAVPGSGKTFTLSLLAATLIRENRIDDDQEVLVVTLANSAVENFSTRIAGFMKEFGLLANVGYRVRTLHGLCHDIVRERPDLVGLSDQFEILDERDCDEIRINLVKSWLKLNPDFISQWINWTDYSDRGNAEYNFPLKLSDLAKAFIRQAKDRQKRPDEIRQLASSFRYRHPMFDFCLDIYENYHRTLVTRSGVDFDDLIQLALQALTVDAQYLQRIRRRWPYVLEDEAQDSTRLQEKILRTLCEPDGNWVRVGDPNQAIYETFTTASPDYLRSFLREEGVTRHDLPESGRFPAKIRMLANYLIEWTNDEHPMAELRDALSEPMILPTQPGDPQAPDPGQPGNIHIGLERLSAEDEVKKIVSNIQKWLPNHQDKTVVIMASSNSRGEKFIEELQKRGIDYLEILKSTQQYRETVETLHGIVNYLAVPNARNLETLYRCLRREELADKQVSLTYQQTADLIKSCAHLEHYFAPGPDKSWVEEINQPDLYECLPELEWLARSVNRWHAAALLPIDQLIMTVAQDLFVPTTEKGADNSTLFDLALAEKIARQLDRSAQQNPADQLRDYAAQLSEMKRSKALSSFREEDQGFEPKAHKGKVVVTTIHKAKGLEWDRVYLTSANNYDFPSLQPNDRYQSERGVRDQLNLEAEVVHRLKAMLDNRLDDLFIEDGVASKAARVDYCSEHLRLFYVAITRSCQDLIISFNTGKDSQSIGAALPLQPLQHFLDTLTL